MKVRDEMKAIHVLTEYDEPIYICEACGEAHTWRNDAEHCCIAPMRPKSGCLTCGQDWHNCNCDDTTAYYGI